MNDAFTLNIQYPTGSPADEWVASDATTSTSVRFIRFSRERWKEAMDVKMPAGQPIGQMRGAYVIRGRDPLVLTVRLYIGHGDLQQRIGSHDKDKEFWSDGVAIVEKSDEWDVAHTGHLETRLIEAAEEAQKCVLTNKQSGGTLLKGTARGDMDRVVKEVVVRLAALGYHEFIASGEAKSSRKRGASASRNANTPSSSSSASAATTSSPKSRKATASAGTTAWDCPPDAEFRMTYKSLSACARRDGKGGLIVLRNSEAMLQTSSDCSKATLKRRHDLIDSGQLKQTGERLVFQEDVRFEKPSPAAEVVRGRATNGKTAWRTRDGRQLGDL